MNYLKSTMTFGQKNKNSFKKELDNEPVYNEEYLKANIKSYNGKINKISNQKRPKEGSQYISLSVILIDSVFQTSKNHYPQVFLEECKYVAKDA